MPTLPPFALEVLRGVGQVVFCNSALSGALITGGLCIGDPYLAGLALAGSASATATAHAAGIDKGAIRDGLMGYNGALVGCAFSVFLPYTIELQALATVTGSAASAVLAQKLGTWTAPVPQWTLAFNITALAALALVQPFAEAQTEDAQQSEESDTELGVADWCAGLLSGISQIFVVNKPLAGLVILGGIASISPLAAAATLMGSLIGLVVGAAVGGDPNDLKAGIWGYNPALTALAVSIFFVPLGQPFMALACGGAAVTTLIFVGMKAVTASTIQAPCLTLPFCAVASACFLMGGRHAGLVHARVPHSPEANLRAYRAA